VIGATGMSPGSRTSVELTDNGLPIAVALVREGDIPSIDGETGAVYLGPIAAAVPSIRISRFCEAGPPRWRPSVEASCPRACGRQPRTTTSDVC
jgi:hypothetical protein